MGCDHYFYILPLLAYTKLIKPKLFQCYGPISRFEILREEKRRKEAADFAQSFTYGKFEKFMDERRIDMEDTPLQRYYNVTKGPLYYAQKDRNVLSEINELLEKESIYKYDERNHFLRNDCFLPYINLFEETGLKIRVSNVDHVENFIEYIEIIKKAFEQETHPTSLIQDYDGLYRAGQLFAEVLGVMKKSEQESVLVLRSAG